MRLGKGIVLQLEGTSILRQLNIHFLACLETYCDFSDMSRPWEVEKTSIRSGFSAWQKQHDQSIRRPQNIGLWRWDVHFSLRFIPPWCYTSILWFAIIIPISPIKTWCPLLTPLKIPCQSYYPRYDPHIIHKDAGCPWCPSCAVASGSTWTMRGDPSGWTRGMPGPGRRELRCIQKRRAEINIETYRNSNKTCKKVGIQYDSRQNYVKQNWWSKHTLLGIKHQKQGIQLAMKNN